MPVKSLHSSVLKWPDRESVLTAVKKWGREIVGREANIVAIGVFGSYAEGRWGPGSDVDIVIIVRDSSLSFEQRPMQWDTTSLPVAADIIVYTQQEWESIKQTAWYKKMTTAIVWIDVSP